MLEKMMPPHNIRVAQLARESGISNMTLYHWRKQARLKGIVVPGDGKKPRQLVRKKVSSRWSLKQASLKQTELATYCRQKGLFVEQVDAWKAACIQANANAEEQSKAIKEQSRQDKKQIKDLKLELRYKEKALAETAALLVLRKKAKAIWGEDEDT